MTQDRTRNPYGRLNPRHGVLTEYGKTVLRGGSDSGTGTSERDDDLPKLPVSIHSGAPTPHPGPPSRGLSDPHEPDTPRSGKTSDCNTTVLDTLRLRVTFLSTRKFMTGMRRPVRYFRRTSSFIKFSLWISLFLLLLQPPPWRRRYHPRQTLSGTFEWVVSLSRSSSNPDSPVTLVHHLTQVCSVNTLKPYSSRRGPKHDIFCNGY